MMLIHIFICSTFKEVQQLKCLGGFALYISWGMSMKYQSFECNEIPVSKVIVWQSISGF